MNFPVVVNRTPVVDFVPDTCCISGELGATGGKYDPLIALRELGVKAGAGVTGLEVK